MSTRIDRRKFLIGGAISGAAIGTGSFIGGVRAANAANATLPLIPMKDLTGVSDPDVELPLIKSVHSFGTGNRQATFGIGTSYLGPLLRVKAGQDINFQIENMIGEVTTLHWHGLHIPGDVDGGPHQEIQPQQTWAPRVPIRQRASLNWFHAHTHGQTARQTYLGLAGVMQIEDQDSLSADLPKSYGVDDFVLVLQDKQFDARGQLLYQLTGEVFENGFTGNRMVINGHVAPVSQSVPKGLVRLRLLNACNARFLKLSWSDNRPVNVIASDGGFLSKSEAVQNLTMAPGERYEILVDMRLQAEAVLQVSAAQGGGDEGEEFLSWLTNTLLSQHSASISNIPVLTLNQNSRLSAFDSALPDALAQIPPPDTAKVVRRRQFELNMEGGEDLAALAAAWGNLCGTGSMSINGRPMNMDVINEEVRIGETEIWQISADEQNHPFHIHGCSFRVLKQQGQTPPAYASGWKDMVTVGEGLSEVLVRFDHEAPKDTPYMYHCHILEHEDCGMMGQFTVSNGDKGLN